ncbi:MAG: aminomethyl-transferring glycine dehydrogenase subunit GcvPA [Thermoplasmata archaeon]|nr:aminomethyl-transferring glycine dehydrogenase subunit GcvPA [Thermoplasmata archaeon]
MEPSPEEREMLKFLGMKSFEELFEDIPRKVRAGLDLPKGKSEAEVLREANEILSRNRSFFEMPNFLGAGVYFHYVPAAVWHLLQRSELYTSYTPYQPEVSQGMLQAQFEYQSLMAELLEMEVVNASMYDWSTAIGEAARMAYRITGKKKFAIPRHMLPDKKEVLKNYVWGLGMEIVEYDYDKETGESDLNSIESVVDEDLAGLYLENPNFLGVVESKAQEIKEILGKAVFVVGVNPISLGILKPPGSYGADIVVGEAQVFGSPPNFGGPLLGIFATSLRHVWRMPGRLIGMSRDADGNRSFLMILQAREQHIRRARATSNICSNEALCAVASAIYLSLLGRSGLRKLALVNHTNAVRLMEMLSEIPGVEIPHKGYHFNEFVARLPRGEDEVHRGLLERGYHGGLRLKRILPELGDSMLLCTTELHTKEVLEGFARALREVVS